MHVHTLMHVKHIHMTYISNLHHLYVRFMHVCCVILIMHDDDDDDDDEVTSKWEDWGQTDRIAFQPWPLTLDLQSHKIYGHDPYKCKGSRSKVTWFKR